MIQRCIRVLVGQDQIIYKEKKMEITDIVGKEMIDIIGLLGTLTDEEIKELAMCTQVGIA